ncbi:hypothetical protein BpHYR1_013306 [Brachionus plicatilis]|uniref:Uncharacterized protein n=1 Tax=Brachionus plicatilis TaxID=10195 RepID=A0A3M7R4Z6_BRAPC|nr:hypothetical protein BpHYR1_013306 [Brachionus plicatilis]
MFTDRRLNRIEHLFKPEKDVLYKYYGMNFDEKCEFCNLIFYEITRHFFYHFKIINLTNPQNPFYCSGSGVGINLKNFRYLYFIVYLNNKFRQEKIRYKQIKELEKNILFQPN